MRPREPPSTSNAEPAWAALIQPRPHAGARRWAQKAASFGYASPLRFSCYPAEPERLERIGWPGMERLPLPAGGSRDRADHVDAGRETGD